MSEITVASTTDTQEAVEQAAGLKAEDAAQPGNEKESQPAVSAAQDEGGEQSDTTWEAGESGDESPEANAAHDEKPPKSRMRKRVDNLTRRVHEQQEELDALRERVGQNGPARSGDSTQGPASPGDSRPVPAGYRTYDEYVEALADWKAGQRLQQQKQVETAQAEQQRAREAFATYNEAAKSARSKYEDFEEVVGRRDLKIPQAAQIAIIESGAVGPDIAYYLGKNPDVCQELAKMSPMRAIARIGQIEAQVQGTVGRPRATASQPQGAGTGTATASPTRRTTTSAPAPITPVG